MQSNGMTDVAQAAQLFKLLGDPTRLTMVQLLQQKERCVCEFVERFPVSQPAISQHLRKLKDAQVVKEEKRGQWVYYTLQPNFDGYPLIQHILNALPEQQEIDTCCE